jgi:hypothetical protein
MPAPTRSRQPRLPSTRSLALALAILILTCLSTHAATYYVATTGNDLTGTGAINNPWRTIGKGLHAMSRGDTLYIRGGIYEEDNIVNRQIKNGLSNDRRTVIASYPGERAIFRPINGDRDGIRTSSGRRVDFLTFDGWTIDFQLKPRFTGGKPVKMYNLHNVTFTNMHFINSTNGSLTQFYSGPRYGPWQGTNVHVVGCLFSNVVNAPRKNGSMPDDSHAIYWDWHPGSIIENNVFISSQSGAITTKETSYRWTIRNNVIIDCRYGMHFRGEDSLIYNNVFMNPGRSGIRARGRHNIYADNTVYADPDAGAEYGVEDHHSQSSKRDSKEEVFLNNTALGSYSGFALTSRANAGQDRVSYWSGNVGSSSRFIRGTRLESDLSDLLIDTPW